MPENPLRMNRTEGSWNPGIQCCWWRKLKVYSGYISREGGGIAVKTDRNRQAEAYHIRSGGLQKCPTPTRANSSPNPGNSGLFPGRRAVGFPARIQNGLAFIECRYGSSFCDKRIGYCLQFLQQVRSLFLLKGLGVGEVLKYRPYLSAVGSSDPNHDPAECSYSY